MILTRIQKSELVAFVLIAIGTALLIFTFIVAYTLLTSNLGIIQASNLSSALGEILGPIAEAIIRALYLGIMGWAGSIATIRGIQLYKEAKSTLQQSPQPKVEDAKGI